MLIILGATPTFFSGKKAFQGLLKVLSPFGSRIKLPVKWDSPLDGEETPRLAPPESA